MTFNSNTFNAIELTEADLDCVSGGGDAVSISSPWLKIERELEADYQKSHPIHLGSFPPPHIAVPRF